MDTQVGQSKKDAPDDVAKSGFEAMMRGDGDVVTGWQNKLQAGQSPRWLAPRGCLAALTTPDSKRRIL